MGTRGIKWWVCSALIVGAVVAGCAPDEGMGDVQVMGMLTQGLSASDVTRVEVTVTGPGMTSRPDVLVKSGAQWGGVLGGIPAGPARVLKAQAFDKANILIYEGQATAVTINPGQTTSVTLLLQQVNAPPLFENAAPIITSLVVSAGAVLPGGGVTLKATVQDANTGDNLTYAWTAGAGTFSSATSLNTTWTAPTQTGPVALTLKVTDSKGAMAALSVTVTVSTGTGNAAVNVSVNTWPQVTQVTATPTAVALGEPALVLANASDNDGDSLSYQWEAGCAGTWTNATSANATFTPTSSTPVSGTCTNCTLSVKVTDGRGGQSMGKLSICVGPKTEARFPPEVVEFFQSAVAVPAGGDTIAFRVKARDVQGSALSFAWTTNLGTLGTATSGATTSEVLWTAPSCVPASTAVAITLTATNALGLSTSIPFALSGGTTCVSSVAVSNWSRYDFAFPTDLPSTVCQGTRYIGYSQGYQRWVGAALCGTDSTKYKLFMSTSRTGPYYEIADTSGHGQDHCELINSTFTIPNGDDITSGGCTTCAVTGIGSAGGRTIFGRGFFGNPFAGPIVASAGYHTSSSYKCGVSVGSNGAATTWSRYDFNFPAGLASAACQGTRYVGFSQGYQKWVGISLCGSDSTKYKIFLADSRTGPFYEIVDTAGNGQDHCELVNTNFTIPNEDDMTSGGCAACTVGAYEPKVGRTVFGRAFFGTQFYGPATAQSSAEDTPEWYKCGISLP